MKKAGNIYSNKLVYYFNALRLPKNSSISATAKFRDCGLSITSSIDLSCLEIFIHVNGWRTLLQHPSLTDLLRQMCQFFGKWKLKQMTSVVSIPDNNVSQGTHPLRHVCLDLPTTVINFFTLFVLDVLGSMLYCTAKLCNTYREGSEFWSLTFAVNFESK